MHAPGRERLLTGLLRLYGVAAVVAGAAAKDPPGGRHTAPSAVHVDATIVGGTAIIAAMALVGLAAPRRASGGRRPCAPA